MARPRLPDGERAADIAPTGVRLPPDLRAQIVKEASINRRSLSQEITVRLRNSFVHGADLPLTTADQAKGQINYVQDGMRRMLAPQLSETQRLLLTLFGELSPEKQLALLTVLKR